MGRNRTLLKLSASQRGQLDRRVRSDADARARERAQCALWAASGQHTLEDLARLSGRRRSTIQNWLAKFKADGVAGLMARDTPPGSVSPIADPEIQAELQAGWKAGRWQSASQVAAWLKDARGIVRSRKSIYYWLGKQRRAAGSLRSRAGRRGGEP